MNIAAITSILAVLLCTSSHFVDSFRPIVRGSKHCPARYFHSQLLSNAVLYSSSTDELKVASTLAESFPLSVTELKNLELTDYNGKKKTIGDIQGDAKDSYFQSR